jgi:hypothetical protein
MLHCSAMSKITFKPLPMQLIKESLTIDPSCPTGLRWLHRPIHHFESDRRWRQANARCAGKPAGNKSYSAKQGKVHASIYIGGVVYQASRVVFALANGYDPGTKDIDHIDGDRGNNHPSNLRAIEHYKNCHNRKSGRPNQSGVTGVSFLKHANRWIAVITVLGNQIHLGCFKEKEEAIAARHRAEDAYLGDASFRHSRATPPPHLQPI